MKRATNRIIVEASILILILVALGYACLVAAGIHHEPHRQTSCDTRGRR